MTSYLVLLAPTLSFLLAPVSRVAPPSRAAAVRMQLPDFGSVGKSVMEKMGMGGPDSGLSEEEAFKAADAEYAAEERRRLDEEDRAAEERQAAATAARAAGAQR